MDTKPFKDRVLDIIKKTTKGNQKKFSKLTGIGESTMSGWFKGDRFPSRYSLEKLRDSLGININWLLTGRGPVYLKEKGKKEASVGTNEVRAEYVVEDERTMEYIRKMMAIFNSGDERLIDILTSTLDVLDPDTSKKRKKGNCNSSKGAK